MLFYRILGLMWIVPRGFVLFRFFWGNSGKQFYSLDITHRLRMLGTIYAELSELEGEGLIEAKFEDPSFIPKGAPRRKLYKMTGMGQKRGDKLFGKTNQGGRFRRKGIVLT